MKQIIKYQSTSGHTFDTEEDCRAYESMLDEIAAIEAATLKTRPDGCGFANGDGYLQHAPEAVEKFRSEWFRLVETIHKGMSAKPEGYIARVLSDGSKASDEVLYRMWTRLYSIDGESREWGQPFYALHPDQGKQNRLN